MVFRLCQEWQRLCRFALSVNRAQSPLWSRMWSTSVAWVRMPRAAHARQKGSRRSYPGRRSSVQIFSEYHRRHAAASGDLGASLGLCWGHQPSRVRVPHPGWRQGRSGFCAMGCHLHTKQKAPEPRLLPVSGSSLAQALVALDTGSGALIFTRDSKPHRLHLRGRFATNVSGRTFRSLPFPHTGQITHSFLMTSVSRFSITCKVHPPFCQLFNYIPRL